MRIMHLSDYCLGGGLETHILGLCKELIKLGHNPFVFTLAMSTFFQEELESLGMGYIISSNLDDLVQYIIANKIELLHGHPTKTVEVTANLAKCLAKPSVVTYHGLVGWGLEYHANLDKIICVSSEVYDILGSSDPKSKSKLVVIQNGVDTETFSPSGETGPGRNIVFAGRLGSDKYISLKIIMRALNSLSDVTLDIVGDGPYYHQLKLEAPDWVRLLGWQEDMSSVINQANIFIGTGRGVREAMACGKPAIALNGCGYDGPVTPQTIESLEYNNFMGRSGKALSEEVILRDIKKLLSACAMEKLGQWSRDYAQKNYSIAEAAKKHIEIYSQLTGHGGMQ